MITEQDIENVKIGDVVEITPSGEEPDGFLHEICHWLGQASFTGKVIGRGINPEDGTRDIFIYYDVPEFEACETGYDSDGNYRDGITRDYDEEFEDNLPDVTQYFGVGAESVESLRYIFYDSVDKNTNEDNGGLDLI